MCQSPTPESVILGLAAGDAFGLPVEFKSPSEIEGEYGDLDKLVGYGSRNQPERRASDDTDMALYLARSLASCGSFEEDDDVSRFVEWFESRPVGHRKLTRAVLSDVADGLSWESASKVNWSLSKEGSNAGNGGLMRAPPVAIAFADDYLD